MNDNDIIKALGFCESPDCECTSLCPMFHNGINSKSACRGELHINALGFINRQKTEIERLNANMDAMVKEHKRLIKTAKNEAIKEFVEKKLKDVVDDPKTFGGWSVDILMDRIDDLVKELTEEQK